MPLRRKLLVSTAPVMLLTASALTAPAFATSCGTNPLSITQDTICTTNGDIIAGTPVSNEATLDLTVRSQDKVVSPVQDGIAIESNGQITITNNGEISGSFAGVRIYRGSGTVTNNGTITGTDGTGVLVVTMTGAAEIINNASGTISGATAAIRVITNDLSTHTITNYGLLSSSADGSAAIELARASKVTVNQYGVVSPGGTGSAGIWLSEAGARLTLNVYAGSSFVGTGVKMADKTYSGSIVNFYAPNYSLAVKNFLLANHSVNALNPGSIVTFTGNDTANGNGTLVVSTPAPSPSASTPSVAQASATAVQSALQMTTPRNYVPPLQNTLLDVGQNASGAGAPGGGGNQGMSNLGMTLRGTQTDDTPTGNAQSIDRHGNLVWARAFGAARFQPANDGIAGSINRTTGVLFGYDRQFTTWRFGAYGGYGLNNSITTDRSAKLQTQLYLAGLYGQTRLAATTFTFNLAGGILGNTSSRFITNGGEVAAADFRGAFLAPDAALAYDMALGRGFTLTPAIRARYIATFTDAYAETGSTQNIIYRDAFTSSFDERAELRLSHKQPMRNGGTFGSYVQAAAIATQRIGSGAVSASILGSEVSVQSAAAGTVTGLSLGAGFDVALSKNLVTYAGIDATQYSDAAQALTGRIGMRWAF